MNETPAALIGTVYETVLGRSRGHCECDVAEPGNCGVNDGPTPRMHRTGGRCYERGEQRVPLLVAPRDPELRGRDAVGLPAEQLMVLCRGCYTRRRKKTDTERAVRNQANLLDEAHTLFSSDLLSPTGLTHPDQEGTAA